ncbi:isopenicillin N synthase family oxygenase [Sphingobium algorifonticola]|uniref:2-oxoglutarate-dependent ethylene/succinate-forming enzyme n=1 Tax=Sphingobium algorifonticola TaxID=2008318 RepID=A0A437JA96_9SPHN|nr:2-oxoglutarate and iron-dependent oxygenase domain-containing protein [Sphingobium algorifonticola]RVT42415.1 isopenicillin N synthase family oxygenase [Sphingobium algorifonticola]
MPHTILDAMPVLSLDYSQPADFAQDFGQSFQRFGFAMVRDHGMDSALVADAWAKAKAFFALPEAAKRAYLIPGGGGQRGYTAYGTEIAKGASENDLKEFWHVGRDLPPGSPLAATMPPNVWPQEIAGFRETFTRLFAEFDRVGARLLSAIALYLGLAPDWFVDPVRDGNSIIRLLHYPPVSADAPGVRAGAHEDINLITMLLGAEEGGLELLDRSGNWLPVTPPEGALVINVGDMLQRLTNHVLPSTSHRVVNPPPERRGVSRYSMPYFLHLRPDFMIEALPQCVTPDNPVRQPPISAHDYLHERLVEIGLVKK